MNHYETTVIHDDGTSEVIVVEARRVEARCVLRVTVRRSAWNTESEEQGAFVGEWYVTHGAQHWLVPSAVFRWRYRRITAVSAA